MQRSSSLFKAAQLIASSWTKADYLHSEHTNHCATWMAMSGFFACHESSFSPMDNELLEGHGRVVGLCPYHRADCLAASRHSINILKE